MTTEEPNDRMAQYAILSAHGFDQDGDGYKCLTTGLTVPGWVVDTIHVDRLLEVTGWLRVTHEQVRRSRPVDAAVLRMVGEITAQATPTLVKGGGGSPEVAAERVEDFMKRLLVAMDGLYLDGRKG